jgi:hypothetical protein
MRWLIPAVIWFALTGCTDPGSSVQLQVLQLHQENQIQVSLSPADAPVEQLLVWSVRLKDNWQIKQAEVTGLSMAMGTIPLLFKESSTEPGLYLAEMVLGACSQPKMQWQLKLTLHSASSGEKMLLLPFYSSWPD